VTGTTAEHEGLADLVPRDSECLRLLGRGSVWGCEMTVAARIVCLLSLVCDRGFLLSGEQ
jgi:hypothetical protein